MEFLQLLELLARVLLPNAFRTPRCNEVKFIIIIFVKGVFIVFCASLDEILHLTLSDYYRKVI